VNADGRLLRVLGLGFGLAVIVGNTIGAGIFRTPGQVAAYLPDARLFLAAWLAGGIYALLGAVQIAELGTMLPRSGGQYVFSRYALGEYAGFVVGWSDWISTCGSVAAVAVVIAEFSSDLTPAFSGSVPAIAAGVAVVFAAAQWRGIRTGSGIQLATSALKGVVFAALIGAAFVLGRVSDAGVAASPAATSGFALAAAFLLALQGVIYTYDGWTGVVYFSEELNDPGRQIPRALFAGVLSVIAIYLLLNLAFLHAVPIGAIAGSPFAAGEVTDALFGERAATVLRVVTIVAMLSAVNAYHLMASRVLFAMSRDGLLTSRATVVNAGGTPTIALLFSTAVSVLFIVFGRTFETVIGVLAFFFIANYTLSFISLLVLRRREPARVRPYKAWGYPWSTGLALMGSVAFLVAAIFGDTRNSMYALLLLAASYPAFRVLKRSRPLLPHGARDSRGS
jgi:APA family basic amino acid/polyamine antiporter